MGAWGISLMVTSLTFWIPIALRLRDGIDLDAFEARFQVRLENVYAKVLDNLQQDALVETVDRHLRLTLRGLYLSNSVFQEFIGYDINETTHGYS